jgi:transcriptional regulator with XRE-family HTH domain
VERLAEQGLTEEEIATALNVSTDTIGRRKRDSADFADAMKRGRAKGADKVSGALMEQCAKGNTAAIIWYEKTRRGLTEHTELLKRIEELEQRANAHGHQEAPG